MPPAEHGPSPSVLLEVRDHVAWLTLNRPHALNALTVNLGRELLETLGRLREAPDVHVVVLQATGRGFSSGIDLKELATLTAGGNSHEHVRDVLSEIFHPLILAIRTLDKPVVAAVNGIALGLGCSLALAADFVVAARSATFHIAFANIGLGVDGGTSALLTARVGFTRATQLALLAEPIGAEQALAWGLINAVAPDEGLHSAAAELAERLGAISGGALAAIKRALHTAAYPHLAEILELEAELQQQRSGSADVAAAVRSFIERRGN